MSAFYPFRGGGRPKRPLSAFFTVFLIGRLPLSLSNTDINSFLFGPPEILCQNKALGVVGGVLGWNTLLIFQSLF